MTLPPHVLREAEKLLSQVAATTVSITRCEPLTQELSVARCAIVGTHRLPPSVILRTHRTVGGWRTDDAYLFSDYAAASFLQRIGSRACAHVIASDTRAGVQVSEDLGSGPSLDDLLAGNDPAVAASAVVAFAHTLGGMHAVTAGRAAEYDRLRTTVGPDDPATYQISLDEKPIPTAWAQLVAGAADRGITADRAVHADVERVLEALRDPMFLALSNGDPCPYNCRVHAGQVRFFDFELAGYRHALLDASYLRLPFPPATASGVCQKRHAKPPSDSTAKASGKACRKSWTKRPTVTAWPWRAAPGRSYAPHGFGSHT